MFLHSISLFSFEMETIQEEIISSVIDSVRVCSKINASQSQTIKKERFVRWLEISQIICILRLITFSF